MKKFYIYNPYGESVKRISTSRYSALIWMYADDYSMEHMIEKYGKLLSSPTTSFSSLSDFFTYVINPNNEIKFRMYIYDEDYMNFISTYIGNFNLKSEQVYNELYSALNEIYDSSIHDNHYGINISDDEISIIIYEELVEIFASNDTDESRFLLAKCKSLLNEDYLFGSKNQQNNLNNILGTMSYYQFLRHVSKTYDKEEIIINCQNPDFIKMLKNDSFVVGFTMREDFSSFLRQIGDTIESVLSDVLIRNKSDQDSIFLFKTFWQFIFMTESVCALPQKLYKKSWDLAGI